MNEKVKKVFELLGVEPNEEFEVMLKDNSKFSYKFKFDEDLQGYCFRDKWRLEGDLLRFLLSGTHQIIKLPKEPKKKKLRDLTGEEWDRWLKKNCGNCNCDKCVFDRASCEASYSDRSWINNKDIYSEKFLNQELEVEEYENDSND